MPVDPSVQKLTELVPPVKLIVKEDVILPFRFISQLPSTKNRHPSSQWKAQLFYASLRRLLTLCMSGRACTSTLAPSLPKIHDLHY